MRSEGVTRRTAVGRLAIPLAILGTLAAVPAPSDTFQSEDTYRVRAVAEVAPAPDGRRIVYSVRSSEGPGRPSSRLWMLDRQSEKSATFGPERASNPVWSPDGARLAFTGRDGGRSGLMTIGADGTGLRFIAPIEGTNHPLPSAGARIAWSPDGRQIAFISATPGPEADANGDPMVITRYLYKPTASEGSTRFNDNRRLHIFIADVATGSVRQLTTGNFYEHSIDWSPNGDQILFVSNRGEDPDRFFNYDVFTVNVGDGRIKPLTSTRSAEYRPTWSPDGRAVAFQATTRPLTSSETTMEDTHVWVMAADGSGRREVCVLDNRQGDPEWSADGQALYFTVQERGSRVLYRQPVAGGEAKALTAKTDSVDSWGFAGKDGLALAISTPEGPSELYLTDTTASERPRQVTHLNADWLASRALAPVESFTFPSFDGRTVEAFITIPARPDPSAKHPMIVTIHGGPHGQQGPAFNLKAQVYAAQGWATLMVNYRGSTGYGQKFTDAIFKDQNGGEAKDVLAGVDAALARYPWIDGARLGIEGGSYGGQLTNWIVTQTDRFRAAIPIAGISNLVSFNYMAYYHDYLAVEFGSFPHENGLMDRLWERSPLRYVQKVRTPVMFAHGENDNDVPIAEAEQFYIALRDVGVETIMVRYPREGHGVRESQHVVDLMRRSIEWYRAHFAADVSSSGL